MSFEKYWNMYTMNKLQDPELFLTEKQIALMFWNACLADTYVPSQATIKINGDTIRAGGFSSTITEVGEEENDHTEDCFSIY